MSATLSPHQCRLGRELAGLSWKSLADRAGITPLLVLAFEAGEQLAPKIGFKLKRALEALNITFRLEGVGYRPSAMASARNGYLRRNTRPDAREALAR